MVRRAVFVFHLTVFAGMTVGSRALAQPFVYGIAAEGVNDYTLACGGSTLCNTHEAWSACGFYATMMTGTAPTNYSTCETTTWPSTTGWTAVHPPYYDNSVFDTDFEDPQASGNSYDDDTQNFDEYGAAITFASGHGTCGDVTPNVCGGVGEFCTAGYCSTSYPQPSGLTQVCIIESPRQFVTSSTYDRHNHYISYGKYPGGSEVGDVRIGEDATSGGWAGAGTNGGANAAVIVNSCAARGPYLWDELRGMFAGVHAVMITAPAGGWADTHGNVFASDNADRAARGANLATLILANPSYAMSDTWGNPTLIAFTTVNVTGGSATPPSGTASLGAHVTAGFDSTNSQAQWHVYTESWLGATWEANDALGSGYGYFTAYCNYDCNTWGLL